MSTPFCVSHQCEVHEKCGRYYANVDKDTLQDGEYHFENLAAILPGIVYSVHEGNDIALCGHLAGYKMFLPLEEGTINKEEDES